MIIYSANNVPYSALSGVITGDMAERNSISSIRFIFVTLATLAIQGFALPMVNHFGEGDSAKGYQITMGIFSALAVIFMFITFFTTKEDQTRYERTDSPEAGYQGSPEKPPMAYNVPCVYNDVHLPGDKKQYIIIFLQVLS